MVTDMTIKVIFSTPSCELSNHVNFKITLWIDRLNNEYSKDSKYNVPAALISCFIGCFVKGLFSKNVILHAFSTSKWPPD